MVGQIDSSSYCQKTLFPPFKFAADSTKVVEIFEEKRQQKLDLSQFLLPMPFPVLHSHAQGVLSAYKMVELAIQAKIYCHEKNLIEILKNPAKTSLRKELFSREKKAGYVRIALGKGEKEPCLNEVDLDSFKDNMTISDTGKSAIKRSSLFFNSFIFREFVELIELKFLIEKIVETYRFNPVRNMKIPILELMTEFALKSVPASFEGEYKKGSEKYYDFLIQSKWLKEYIEESTRIFEDVEKHLKKQFPGKFENGLSNPDNELSLSFIIEIMRTEPNNYIFLAKMLAAIEFVNSKCKGVCAISLVGPEHQGTAVEKNSEQMKIIESLVKQTIHNGKKRPYFTWHFGEKTGEIADQNRFVEEWKQLLSVAKKGDRVGHACTVNYFLSYLRTNEGREWYKEHLAAGGVNYQELRYELCSGTNKFVLGISLKENPLLTPFKEGVLSVIPSPDDGGVIAEDFKKQFEKLVKKGDLTYGHIWRMFLNGLQGLFYEGESLLNRKFEHIITKKPVNELRTSSELSELLERSQLARAQLKSVEQWEKYLEELTFQLQSPVSSPLSSPFRG